MSERQESSDEYTADSNDAVTGEIPIVPTPENPDGAKPEDAEPADTQTEAPQSKAPKPEDATNDAVGASTSTSALQEEPRDTATDADEFKPARSIGVIPLDDAGKPKEEFSASAGKARKWGEDQQAGMPRFIKVTLGLAATCIILMFVRDLQDIIAPVFLGLNLMIVVYPVQKFLQRWVPPFVGAMVSLLLVLVILVLFVWLIVWSLLALIQLMPSYNEQFVEAWQWIQKTALDLNLDFSEITKSLQSIQPNDVMSLLAPLFSNVSSILALLTTLVIATLFLAMDSAGLHARQQLLRITKPRALIVTNDFAYGVRRYWLVTTVFGLIVAIADVGALWLLGIPLVWVWGILSFITNYIPNVGFFIGLIPPALLAFLEKGWGSAVAVIVAYSVLNFVIQSIIQPKFAGESVGVTPTVSFLSLLFWVWVLGPLGALLALPATLLLKSFLIDSDPNARWLNTFIAVPADSALPEDEQPMPLSERKARAWRERKAILRG
ncbi:AI-2E family transporter [Pseudoglutamicibacter albus]|uniref:PurR-regulated permease PerM n=1 Tax=Pseudoglutamicibacter albus TaxID=98671 RepID=A0ABU1Z2V6_9MICC|nr:AI-2E family transporter [Pseudoglutamicibacter albus]MDR7294331.1 putative PurR-regulated permease PerM [Pseudoglutamicibacter albus]